MQNAKMMRACIWTAIAAFTSVIAVELIGTLALLEEGQTIALRTRSTVAAMQLASTCKISLAGPTLPWQTGGRMLPTERSLNSIANGWHISFVSPKI